MILYHASTVPISSFYIPYGGLHLGGMYSALEAALRKLRSDKNVHNDEVVYLHRVQVDLGRIVLMDDLGGDEEWRGVFSTEYDSVQYVNSYEPDVVHSYMVWDTSRVQVIDVDPIHMDDAEDTINELLERY